MTTKTATRTTTIGRVGTLAAALGVGLALAVSPTASADPADADTAGTARSDTAGTARSGAAPARRSAAPTGADAESPRVTGPRTSRQQAPALPAAAAADTSESSARTPLPDVPVVRAARAAADRPARARAVVPAVPATPVAASVSVGAGPDPTATPAPALTTAAARPAADLVGAVAYAAAQLVEAALGPLLGDNPNAPVQTPLLWTVLAWARRELELPAAATSAVTTNSVMMSPNLLVNPGAEFGDPSLSGYSAVTIPGWAMTGTPTVIEYDAPRNLWPIGTSFKMPDLPPFLGFPTAQSGPPDGGNQFFGGGNVGTGTLTQTVDLRGAAAEIDLGSTAYNLGAWLGGYLFDRSGSSVKVTFLDENRTYLGDAELSRVGPLERWFQTGFKERTTTGVLPIGTRYAQVVLTLEDRYFVTFGIPWLLGGVDFDYNNAFADNISFSVGATLPAPPDPTPPVSTVGELDHVFMVYMENKGYNDIVGSTKAPFLNSLIDAYGHANQYHGLTHPSLPNYYPVIGGTDFGLTYNCASPCIDADTTLVSNIIAAGKTWKGYAQSLEPGASPLVSSGDYATDQLPFPAFKSIANDPDAVARIVPLEQMAVDLQSVDTAPNYLWFAANEDFNGEGPIDFPWGVLRFALSQLEPGNPYNIPALDQFLSETVPVVLNSAVWKDPTRKSALVVTFDEDNNNTSLGFGNEGNKVVFVVIPSPGAVAAGMRSGNFIATNHYNHYSLLRFIEESLGLPTLTNNDKFAAPLNEFWGSIQV